MGPNKFFVQQTFWHILDNVDNNIILLTADCNIILGNVDNHIILDNVDYDIILHEFDNNIILNNVDNSLYWIILIK